MPLMIRRIVQSTVALKAFRHDRKGAIAIMFAVSLIPLLPLFAFTVDYGVVSLTKAKLDAAADSSILTATVAAANTYVGNGGNLAQAQTAGQNAGKEWYNKQLLMAGFSMNPAPPDPQIDINLTNTTFTASLSYTATSPSYFGSLLGKSFYNLSGGSNSSYVLPGYLDLVMMIDNSPSMEIIADLANWPGYSDYLRNNYNSMWKGPAQSKDCMFACHDVNTVSDTSKPNTDLYYIAEEYAKKININLLRIDVVGAAIQSVLQAVQATQANDHYRVGLYTFSDSVQQIFALSSDFSGAATAAKAILPIASGSGSRTNLPPVVSSMISKGYLTAAGDGLSSKTPKKALLLITDGTNNTGNDNITPFDYTQCQKIKDLKIDIYVMYTQYYPVKQYYPGSTNPNAKGRETWYDHVYETYILPLQSPTDQIQANLRNCASTPDKYYSVSDAASIKTALTNILTAALAQPGRFTQ